MKKAIVYILSIFIFILNVQPMYAFSLFRKNGISKVVNEANLENSSTISIVVKDLDGKKLYSKNENKLLNPASTLKVLTFASSLNTLGEDYEFKTSAYLKNNDLYIKLGADPLLTYKDLKNLIVSAKNSRKIKLLNKIYIDDTIIDSEPYTKGLLSDDIPFDFPKLSPYTLNQNQIDISFRINEKNQVQLFIDDVFKMPLINEVTTGSINKINFEKKYGDDNDIVTIKGTINGDYKTKLAVDNPKRYFLVNLEEILSDSKIEYGKLFDFKQTPKDAVEISSVSHTIKEIANSILSDSNNFTSEIVFKVAGAKYENKLKGTTQDGISMFENYYNKLGFDTNRISVVDSSGISRYNLMSASFMSDVLIYLFNNTNIKDYMAEPNMGTLAYRLRYLKGNLWAKTGTLLGASAISGLIIKKNGKKSVFVIMIQNHKQKRSLIKSFEDDVISAIYKIN